MFTMLSYKNLISLFPYRDHGAISVRKILFALIFFELVAMVVILFGDRITWAYFFSIIFTPVFLIAIPIEPVVGLVGIIITTGIDFLGQIGETTEEATFRLTYFHLVMILTLASVFLHLLLKKRISIPSFSVWPPIILFLIAIAISTIYTPDFKTGCIEFARIAFMVLTMVIVMIIVNNKWRSSLVVWSMILIPFFVSVLALYQLINEGSIFAPIVRKVATEIGMPVYRSTGTFSNPNALGCFLMVGIIPAFALLFDRKLIKFLKVMLVMSIAVTSIALLISFSRGSWLSTLAGFFFVIILHRKWSYIAYFLILVIAVFIVLAITEPVVVEAVLDRFESIFDLSGDRSSSSRLSLIKSAIWMWQDNPILGVGIGGFAYSVHNYTDPNMPHQFVWIREAHTLQAKILAEQGLIGFTIAVWLFITVLLHGIKSIGVINDSFLKNAQIGLTALYIGFIVNFTFASDPFNNIFWMLVGLLYAVPLIDSMYFHNNVIYEL